MIRRFKEILSNHQLEWGGSMISYVARKPRARMALGVIAGLGAAVSLAAPASAAMSDPQLSELLKKQTQAFSEAGQNGDAATIARYLDPDVAFTNETGEIATKKEIVDSTSPPPPGAGSRHIEVTNWVLHRQGQDLATATFIDQLTQDFHGQQLVLRFQSTETWAKRKEGWKMIASHTMNAPRDPAAITLSPAELDEYVGTYQLDSTYSVKIARDGEGLTASANAAPGVAMKVEVKDVLFIPGAFNVRRIFQRDQAGHVIGYISRRDGSDLILKKVA
jgi:ketosteroid isomerase-like protein